VKKKDTEAIGTSSAHIRFAATAIKKLLD